MFKLLIQFGFLVRVWNRQSQDTFFTKQNWQGSFPEEDNSFYLPHPMK